MYICIFDPNFDNFIIYIFLITAFQIIIII